MAGVPQDQRHQVTPVDPVADSTTNRTYSTTEDETVPAGMYRVIITCDAASWIRFGGTAVIPTAETGDSIFLAAGVRRAWRVTPAQKIGIIAASGTAHASFEYYSS